MANPKESCSKKVLVVDDSLTIREIVKSTLIRGGYQVVTASNGIEALEKAERECPDLILLDVVMPLMDGLEACQRLRSNVKTTQIPIIMLTDRSKVYDKIAGLKSGADDYMTKPFDPLELVARVSTHISRTELIKAVNPLTGLPGSSWVESEIVMRIKHGKKFAVGYVDLDNFKPFNDFYGFSRGDKVIKLVADIITATLQQFGGHDDLAGHIGGDDFIFVTTPDTVETISGEIVKKFDEKIPAFYGKADRDKGFIVTSDRQGREQEFPIMTISIGVVSNARRKLTCVAELSAIGAEVKAHAKCLPGSNYFIDRRSSLS
jgi:diguanylate cyclase (GGDEF)-like protein